MLENLLEIYLTSIKEIQFFLPFKGLLKQLGYFDIHIVHGKNELGRDLIAKKKITSKIIQYSFQLKSGDISLSSFRSEAREQIIEASTSIFPHPNYNQNLETKVVFVTTGKVTENTLLSIAQLNEYLVSKNIPEIEYWEKNKLIDDFNKFGIEAFFSVHNGLSKFNDFYSFYNDIIQNNLIDFVYIEKYSKRWLSTDWSVSLNRLQVYFESYFLSKVAYSNNRKYESLLIISSLIRILKKNRETKDLLFAIQYYEQIVFEIVDSIEGDISDKDTLLKLSSKSNFLSLFSYPIICLRLSEILSITILINKNENLSDKILDTFTTLINKHPGCCRPLSDNYAVTVLFVSLALYRLGKKELLKKYLVNCTVWICDRYDELGLGFLGCSPSEEIEQLLSEHLDGFAHSYKTTSFLASTILQIAIKLKDKTLYESLAHEFKASEIILQFFHILDKESMFGYESETIKSFHTEKFYPTFEEEFCEPVSYELENSKINEVDLDYLFIIQLLRDRVFVQQLFKENQTINNSKSSQKPG